MFHTALRVLGNSVGCPGARPQLLAEVTSVFERSRTRPSSERPLFLVVNTEANHWTRHLDKSQFQRGHVTKMGPKRGPKRRLKNVTKKYDGRKAFQKRPVRISRSSDRFWLEFSTALNARPSPPTWRQIQSYGDKLIGLERLLVQKRNRLLTIALLMPKSLH